MPSTPIDPAPLVVRRLFSLGILAAGLLLGPRGSATPAAEPKPRPLFDGTSLAGWDVREGEERWWKVADGAIIGGSSTENVPHNTFVSSRESFQNFDLQLKIRIRGQKGFVNSGVQIRSIRAPGNHEMIGYQVDAGDKWWGKLYDESRRKKVIAAPVDDRAAAGVRANEWNDYRILAEGPRIRAWINGEPAFDYTENDPKIPLDGLIGLQVHGGGTLTVEFKDISIRSLPPTPDAAGWGTPLQQPKSPAP